MEESAPTLNLADVRRTIEPLYEGQKLFTGESVMAHAEGVVDILRGIRDDDDLLAAAYLFCVWNQLKNPKEWLTKHFGKQVCELVANLKVVIDVSEKARSREGEARISQQPDAVRRLLLALCNDLRVVLRSDQSSGCKRIRCRNFGALRSACQPFRYLADEVGA